MTKQFKYYSENFSGGVMGNVHDLVIYLNEHHPDRDVIHIDRVGNSCIYVWREEVDVEGWEHQLTCIACGFHIPQETAAIYRVVECENCKAQLKVELKARWRTTQVEKVKDK